MAEYEWIHNDWSPDEFVAFLENSQEGQQLSALALTWAAIYEYETNIRYLVAHGLPVNARHRKGWTALHATSLLGFAKAAKILLDCGADVNARCEKQYTALHLAACVGSPAVAELLIAYNADLEARDVRGDTPLQLAMTYNFVHIVDLLLRAGAKMYDRGSHQTVRTDIMEDVNQLLEQLKLE